MVNAPVSSQEVFYDFDTTGPTADDEIPDFFDLYGFDAFLGPPGWEIVPNPLNPDNDSNALHIDSNDEQLEDFFSRVAIVTALEVEDAEISCDVTWDDDDTVGLYLRFQGEEDDPFGNDYYHMQVTAEIRKICPHPIILTFSPNKGPANMMLIVSN